MFQFWKFLFCYAFYAWSNRSTFLGYPVKSVWSKFLGGGGVVDGEGVAVKGALSGVVGVIKGSFQKHLKTGGG